MIIRSAPLLVILLLACWGALPLPAADDHSVSDALAAEAQMFAPAFIVETGPAPTAQQKIQVGEWGPVISWTPHIPVTAATLPDGRLLTFASNQRTTFPVGAEFTYAAVWNPATGVFTEINNNRHDMFCGGTAMLPDGRLMVNGGRNTTRLSSIFDWRTGRWSAVANMNDGRWYNTSVALTDGSVFTVTGDGGTNTTERWKAADGWKRFSGINWATVVNQPGYVTRWHPLIVVAPDGRLFHGGPTRQMNWISTQGNGSLSYAGVNVPGTHYPKEGCFAMYDEGKILVAGGSLNTNPNPKDSSTGTSTNLAFTLDIQGTTPVVAQAASMKYVRQFANSVILPTGEVMVIGGNSSGLKFNDTGSILSPEIWNPATGRWREVTDMSVPRNYHSLALLLPDGRVWSGGGGLSGNSADHRDAQIYTPPSLFAADGTPAVRPVISQAPGYISTGTVFSVQATPGIQKFTFIKMSSQTHSMNTDLRCLSLPFEENAPGLYSLTGHSNLNVMTPGYWMLFAIAADGVYSTSKIILVDPATRVALATPETQYTARNTEVTLALYGVAPGGGGVIFSATGLPPGLILNSNSGLVTGKPTQLGTYTVELQATDGVTSAETDFTWTVTPADTEINYTTFRSSNSHFRLNGSASVQNNVLQLTPNGANQAGSAWLKDPLPVSATTSFTSRFVFRMNGSGDGADGMTFTLQNDHSTALGSGGGGLGYEGILESLAIELDTYAGGTDPNANHVAVITRGLVSPHNITYTAPFDLENGAAHTLWVEYDGAADILRVYLAQGDVTQQPANAIITLQNVILDQLVGASTWIGFTAATGGSTNTHEVLSWSFFSNAFSLPAAPVLAAVADQTAVLGLEFHLPLNATDANQDSLTYSATGLPAGLTLNPLTGIISGKATTTGRYNVTASVTDGRSAPVSRSFKITVNNALALHPLVTAPVQAGTNVTYTAQPQGGASPRFRWDFGDGGPVTEDSTSLSVTRSFANPGRYLVTLTATDSTGSAVSVSAYQIVHPALPGQKPAQSTSIAYETRSSGNARVWVVNPDSDTVSVLDAVTRTRLKEIPVGRAPRSVAVAPDGKIWVVNKEDATLTLISSSSLAAVSTVSLPRGSQPFGLAFAPNGSAAYLALEGTGQVLQLNANTAATQATQNAGPHARHVSISADSSRLYVSRFISPPVPLEETAAPQPNGKGGEVVVLKTADLAVETIITLAHSEAEDTPTSASGIPNYLGAVAISPDGLSAWVPSKQDNILRGTLRNGVGLNHDQTLRAIASRIQLDTREENLAARIDFDNAGIPSAAVFDPWGGYLYVALESSRSVAVVDARNGLEIMRFAAGRAPQGLAISPDGKTLFVQNFMDRSVTVHDVGGVLAGGTGLPTAQATVSSSSLEKLSAQVLRGKQLFYDALDPRLALQEYISCAGCHNDGGHDGRTWDLTGFGEGLRNTITLRGHGSHGMLHWSANFDEVQDFEGQIRNLAGGTGLMSDADFNSGTRNQPLGSPKAGLSDDLDALAAYVKSLVSESHSPHRSSDGSLTAMGKTGEKVFRQKNCAACHSGAAFSDSQPGVAHDIGTLKPSSGRRLNGELVSLDTPTLRGVWATAPYLHDGSAATLAAAVQAHQGLNLSAGELEALAAYLLQLDNAPAAAPVPVTVQLMSSAPATVSTAFTVTAVFSHAVTGLAAEDISVTGGSLQTFTGSGASYTFTIMPFAEVTVNLAANAAADADGLGNEPAAPLTRSYIPAPPVFVGQDLGTLALTGLTSFDAATGRYTLTASGPDIFFAEDGFHFSHVLLNGDGEIRARVRAFGNTNPWAKAGVMIRENLSAASRHAMAFITPPAAGNGFGMVARQTQGASSDYVGGPALNPVPDNWVRLVRAGNNLTGYVSNDGLSWTSLGSIVLSDLSQQVYIGLAATSGQLYESTTAVFDQVQIMGQQVLAAPQATLLAASATETGPFTVQVRFDQPVSGLAADHFLVANGTAHSLSGSGSSYAVTITPSTPGEVRIQLSADAVQNAAGLANAASNAITVSYVPPMVITLQGQDVGSVQVAGQTAFGNGTYTLTGSGEDIFFTQDGFQFALTQLNGDGEIRARVTSQTLQNPWAKAGVMFRETLAADSRHTIMFTTPMAAGNGFGMVWRSAAGGSAEYKAGPALHPAPDNWVRIVRAGDRLTAYASQNGTAWTWVGETTLSGLPNSMYVGLALTSGVRDRLSTATFDNVQIVGTQAAVAPEFTLSSSSPLESGPFRVRLDSSQSVTGLDLSDFAVTNGSASGLTGGGTEYSVLITPAAGGIVTVQVPAGAASNSNAVLSKVSNTLQVTYQPWLDLTLNGEDVGNSGAAGSTHFNAASGTYTLQGSGSDIFFAEDGFQFASVRLAGDGEIRARITGQTLHNPWGKAGVMFREGLAGNARHVTAFATPAAAENGFGTVWRPIAGAATEYAGGPALHAVPDNWLRLVRQGDTLTAYTSANGQLWEPMSVIRMENLPQVMHVGLAVTSAIVGELGSATFDHVQISGTPVSGDSSGEGSQGSSNAKDRDFDGDDINDLIEYALGSDTVYDGGFWLETRADGQVDARLVHPRAVSDVSFSLETSADMETWTPLNEAPETALAGNSEEMLTWRGIHRALPAQAQQGLVRLRVLHASGIQAATPPQCWQRLAFQTGTQTLGVSWVNAPLYAGFASRVSGASTLVMAGTVPAEAASADWPCYLEIRDGSLAGHRLEVSTITGQNITFDLASPLSTLRTLPVELAGARVVLRPHITLAQVLPKEWFLGAPGFSKADQVLFFKEAAWETCWLEHSSRAHEWRPIGSFAQASADRRPIPPGTGVMVKISGSPVNYTLTGHVRTGGFYRALDQTHNLLALPWPVDATPDRLRFYATEGFTAGVNSMVADQLQLYHGDNAPGAEAYDVYWLRISGSNGAWIPRSSAGEPDTGAVIRLPASRAFFLKIMPRSGESVWRMQPPPN